MQALREDAISLAKAFKPETTIVKSWQGIVDVVLRALVSGMSLSLLILTAGLSVVNVPLEPARTNLRGLAGWSSVVFSLILVVDLVAFAARFTKVSFVHRQALLVAIIDVSFHAVAILCIIPAAVVLEPSRLLTCGEGSSCMPTTMDYCSYEGVAAVVMAFTIVLFLLLAAVCAYSVLWYVLRWFELLVDHSPSRVPQQEPTDPRGVLQ